MCSSRVPPEKKPSSSKPPRSVPAPRSPVRHPLPPITFPDELPVSARREEIARAISLHQVVIVCGETGSGKTTQLPKICLTLGRGANGLIGHTQPRRLAASSTARRIAQELGSPPGEHVGFKIRFNDTLSEGAWIKLMTDGILLAETQGDPMLRKYDTLIIDEAHERSLNIDFLLGFLKQLLPKRPDLKVIITSATIDADRFARHFGTDDQPAPVIEVSGRLYPVDIRYRPVQQDLTPAQLAAQQGGGRNVRQEQREQRDLMDAVVDACDELCRVGAGDILIFLPGEREIREATEALRKHGAGKSGVAALSAQIDILPLFARLSAQEQDRVFRPTGNRRRIVLATNVAETSLTVPGIRYVIDTGLARVKRYSYRNKVEQLQIEPIAQSAANQRAGRCGRVAAGVCIRLYEESDFNARPAFGDPEILRSSLASVILRMKSLRLGEIDDFPFLEAPSGRAIADGHALLQELGAVDEGNALTPSGRELARLPLDPRIGRMLLAAREHVCLSEMLIIASALSVQDPRDRPLEAQAAADQAHKQFADPRSEFMSYLSIWNWFGAQLEHKKSNRQLQDQCRAVFLSQLRLREWRDVHSQLLTIVREQGWRLNEAPGSFDQIHWSLLTGLLGNIGFKSDEDPHYLGARGIRFFIWPGSALQKKPGKWVMAAELVDTSRLYARCIATITPEWIEKIGAHLLKRSWGEPHWEKRSARVTVAEKATLYGVIIYSQRRVDYSRIDVADAREIFIRDALVGGEFDTKAPFFAHNRKVIGDIQNIEHKSRRLDVLVDDELIAAFYEQQIPDHVCNGATFDAWYKKAAADQPRLLFLDKQDLMRYEAAGITTDVFPKLLRMAGTDLALTYHFEPGNPRDGVTLSVPLIALNQIDAARCEWLVPGMLKDKVQLLLKSLPQKLRRHCVPLPAYAEGFCERIAQAGQFGKGTLQEALIADIRAELTLIVMLADFKLETLPPHHFMNFRLLGEHGRQLDSGRSLGQLQQQYGAEARAEFQKMTGQGALGAAFAALGSLKITPEPVAASASSGKTSAVISAKLPVAGPAPVDGQTQAAIASAEPLTSWSFGALPEILELQRGKQVLVGFPALVDKKSHCEIEVFDEPTDAAKAHYLGLRRLFALQLKEPLKFLEKNLPNLQQMGMQYMALGSQEDLRDQIIMAGLERAAMQEPLPLNEGEFNQRKDEARSRIGLLTNEIARLCSAVLTEYHGLAKRIGQAKVPPAVTDMQQQLQQLLTPKFIAENEYSHLAHFPRYLKAIGVRLDRLRADPARDAKLLAEWQSVAAPWQRALKEQGGLRLDPRFIDYRWMLEELRVSLFAQELRTPMPVSAKRLQKVWEMMRR